MRTTEHLLIEALHAGVFEVPRWSGFLSLLRARTRADTAMLRIAAGGSGFEDHVSGAAVPVRVEGLNGQGGGTAAWRSMREGRVYSIEELVEGDPGIDAANVRLVRFGVPGGGAALLGVAGGNDVGSAASALLTAIVPHARVAVRTQVAFERERMRSAIGTGALARLGFDWWLVDGAGQVLDRSDGLDDDSLPGIASLRDGAARAKGDPPRRPRDLGEAVRICIRNPETAPIAVRLASDPVRDLLVMPVCPAMLPGKGAAIVFVHSGTGPSMVAEPLANLFALSPSEARLAVTIINGATLSAAATALGITEETARNYSKRIFAKTGTHGQSDLIRAALTGVATLARLETRAGGPGTVRTK